MENYADYEDFSVKAAVVGVGGAGSNLINRMHSQGIKSATTIAMNTDAKHLSMIGADKKLLIGKDVTRGLGAGGFPEVAAKAADVSRVEIAEAIKDYNLIFMAVGLGGGTGGGAGPVVAEMARENGALVVTFATYPFSLERSRKVKADWSLERLSRSADSVILIENDRLLSYAPNLSIDKSFELVDNVASNAVKGIADAIKFPSLINIDFSDLGTVIRDSGIAMINIGFGTGSDKINNVINSTLKHPLLNVDMSGARSALVHIAGGTSLTIDEVTRVGSGVTEHLDDNANVIFGARLSPEMQDQIRVMSVVTGVKPQLDYPVKMTRNSEADVNFLEGLESI